MRIVTPLLVLGMGVLVGCGRDLPGQDDCPSGTRREGNRCVPQVTLAATDSGPATLVVIPDGGVGEGVASVETGSIFFGRHLLGVRSQQVLQVTNRSDAVAAVTPIRLDEGAFRPTESAVE